MEQISIGRLVAKLLRSNESELDSLKEFGVEYRIASRDGEQYMLTCDYREDRINVDINGGIITNCWVG